MVLHHSLSEPLPFWVSTYLLYYIFLDMSPYRLWLMVLTAKALARAFTLSPSLIATAHQKEPKEPDAVNFAGCVGNCSDPGSLPNQQSM